MVLHSLKTLILLLLTLLSGAGASLLPLVTRGDDSQHFFLMEEEADCDDEEESSKPNLLARLELCNGPSTIFGSDTGFDSIPDVGKHPIDWVFVHEHAARAPPQG